jgi:hypothetical protein
MDYFGVTPAQPAGAGLFSAENDSEEANEEMMSLVASIEIKNGLNRNGEITAAL